MTQYLTVVGWKLVQQLFDPVSLPKAVHIRHSVLWQAAEVLVHLSGHREELLHQDRSNTAQNHCNFCVCSKGGKKYFITALKQICQVSFLNFYFILFSTSYIGNMQSVVLLI